MTGQPAPGHHGAPAPGPIEPTSDGAVRPDKPPARAGVADRGRWHRADVDPGEREHLAAGVGAALRATRTAAGLSMRELAAQAGAGVATISCLESGTVRPRPRMLADLAAVLDPDGTADLAALLAALAGPSLRADTPAGLRRRRRRVARVRRQRADLARSANTAIRRAGQTIEALASLPWRSGALARTSSPALQRQLALFDRAGAEYDRLRADAAAIGARLRRRPRSTTNAVLVAAAAFAGGTAPTSRAARVTERAEANGAG